MPSAGIRTCVLNVRNQRRWPLLYRRLVEDRVFAQQATGQRPLEYLLSSAATNYFVVYHMILWRLTRIDYTIYVIKNSLSYYFFRLPN